MFEIYCKGKTNLLHERYGTSSFQENKKMNLWNIMFKS